VIGLEGTCGFIRQNAWTVQAGSRKQKFCKPCGHLVILLCPSAEKVGLPMALCICSRRQSAIDSASASHMLTTFGQVLDRHGTHHRRNEARSYARGVTTSHTCSLLCFNFKEQVRELVKSLCVGSSSQRYG
jgi:hypothetical protein